MSDHKPPCPGPEAHQRGGTPTCMGHRRANVDKPEVVPGSPCTQWPMKGQEKCKMHGGKTPSALAAAQRRLAEQAATKEAARFATRRDIHPADALLELVQWTAGEVDYWRTKVDQLADEELAGSLVTKVEKGSDKGQPTDLTTTEAVEHVYVRMLAKASDRLATYAAAALRAGCDERRVRIAEQQGTMVAAVIRRVLDALNLTPAQAELVPVIVPRELRALAAPSKENPA